MNGRKVQFRVSETSKIPTGLLEDLREREKIFFLFFSRKKKEERREKKEENRRSSGAACERQRARERRERRERRRIETMKATTFVTLALVASLVVVHGPSGVKGQDPSVSIPNVIDLGKHQVK